METKIMRQLFQKLIYETISVEELHLFYTYVKRAKSDVPVQQLLLELWHQAEFDYYTSPEEPDNGFHQLQKRMWLLDLLVQRHTHPEEIDQIIEKIVKGHYD